MCLSHNNQTFFVDEIPPKYPHTREGWFNEVLRMTDRVQLSNLSWLWSKFRSSVLSISVHRAQTHTSSWTRLTQGKKGSTELRFLVNGTWVLRGLVDPRSKIRTGGTKNKPSSSFYKALQKPREFYYCFQSNYNKFQTDKRFSHPHLLPGCCCCGTFTFMVGSSSFCSAGVASGSSGPGGGLLREKKGSKNRLLPPEYCYDKASSMSRPLTSPFSPAPTSLRIKFLTKTPPPW